MAVEVISTLGRKVNFNVNKEAVNGLVATELRKYAKQAKIQGFRPGKAPKHMIEQAYGGRAYEDALNKQLNKDFVAELVEHKLNIVGYPKFDLASSEGDDFVFSATFEVMPEVKLGDLSAVEIEKPVCTISATDVDSTIEILRKQRATYLISTDAASAGDKVTIDFNGCVDGVPFTGGQAEDYSFILGQGRMLADFEAGILGMKTGETKEILVNFPEDYHAPDLKGKTAAFVIKVKEIEQAQLPQLTSDFIKSLGIGDGTDETLRAEIKENLQLEVDRRLAFKARDNALNALVSVSPVDAPKALVEEESQRMLENAAENMKAKGQKTQQLTPGMFESEAKNLVILRLLVQEFIKEKALVTTDDDVEKIIVEQASMYEDPKEYISWHKEDQQRLDNIKALAMERKVTAAIFSLAKGKEIVMSYKDVMQVNY
jgi:trigger factor